ncbi:hypothetical protein [Bradyrhizobium ottawaense]|uniref:hypothetical protein n=1 Tax=Bradyrhizobium ottawaense TaxID=931866 RepID=UPI0030F49176
MKAMLASEKANALAGRRYIQTSHQSLLLLDAPENPEECEAREPGHVSEEDKSESLASKDEVPEESEDAE